MQKFAIESGVQTINLDSWKEFAQVVQEVFVDAQALIYRGEANWEWKLESTIDRLENAFPTKKNSTDTVPTEFNCSPVERRTHLNAFRAAMQGKRGVSPPKLTDDECWALAQHYGLATPMLDWTHSPFVSLFFAFEKELACKNEKDKDGTIKKIMLKPEFRAVYAMSFSVLISVSNNNGPRPFYPKEETTCRLLSQGGLFLKMPRKTDLESYVKTHFSDYENDPVLIKVKIPNSDRIECLKDLNKMNIHRMSLFPDLDGACKYINALWELNWDTSLGYIPTELKKT